ncbi:ATP synthase F0 subunit B [Candidatus Saganbacteria bacterium CG08_land_8_20_14_0_20_45_16]|uniref:ATP synthase subunit b n=1 Tax=Candidatus Saganbacteria bacterium CG08_land_8_20_14_0_20_45_16 TaxID=2014293 RepID=A0A2H0Y0Q3_UNCSA|nr:MAG: ATP synthase F0 subunit B [Candidatus Saganbacteria bacterium CG08_land_8_20_14_0_20_45_16]
MFEINTGMVFWTFVSFFILLFLLYKLVFPPLNKVLEARRQAIEGRLGQAKKAQVEAEGLLAKYRDQLREAEKKTSAIFDEAKQQAQVFREESLKSAQREAKAVIERTKEDIDRFKRQSLTTFKEEIVEVVIEVNRRLIQKELSRDDHKKLVAAAIAELEKNVKE